MILFGAHFKDKDAALGDLPLQEAEPSVDIIRVKPAQRFAAVLKRCRLELPAVSFAHAPMVGA